LLVSLAAVGAPSEQQHTSGLVSTAKAIKKWNRKRPMSALSVAWPAEVKTNRQLTN
jgi:hypothetical protein